MATKDIALNGSSSEEDILDADIDPFSNSDFGTPETLEDSSFAVVVAEPSTVFDNGQRVSLLHYMTGQTDEPGPENRSRTLAMVKRLGTFVGVQVARAAEEWLFLDSQTSKIRRKIFSDEAINNYPPFGEEIQKLYRLAATEKRDTENFILKSATTQRDILEMMGMRDPNPLIHEMVSIMATLPNDTLGKVMTLLVNPHLMKDVEPMSPSQFEGYLVSMSTKDPVSPEEVMK